MIIGLMMLALWTTALLGAGAWVAERLLRPAGLQTRFVWLVAMGTGAAVVVLAPFRMLWSARAAVGGDTDAVASDAPLGPDLAEIAASAAERLPTWIAAALLVAWIAASGLTMVLFAVGHLRHRRLSARASIAELAGVAVRVSEEFGPAVIGLAKPAIVVPRWLLERPLPEQRLVIAHEQEHLTRRDPLLLVLGAAVVVLMPWNPIVWWCFDQLRLATELDCDARVLRAGAPPRTYGALLIDLTAAQPSRVPRIGTPAFFIRPSLLERRLLAMSSRPVSSRRRGAAIVLAAAVTVASVLSACSSELKTPPTSVAGEKPAVMAPNATYFDFQVEKTASAIPGSGMPRYPAILRSAAVEGQVVAQFVVDTTGRVEPGSFTVVKSTHDLFVQSVRAALPSMRFEPAQVGGRKVRQQMQQPFVFQLSR